MLVSARPGRMARLVPPILLLLAMPACSHSDAFSPHDTTISGPLTAGDPVRLTYNPQADLEPAWLPDGTAVIYAFGVTDLRQGDQCLGVMAAAGGTLLRQICNSGTFAADTTDLYSWPAVADDGRLAYFRSSYRVGGSSGGGRLAIAPLTAPDSITIVTTFPRSTAAAFYLQPAYVHWLDAGRLVFLGLVDTPIQPFGVGNLLVRNGHDALIADLATAPAVLSTVPGTAYATSVATAAGNPDLIYYTLAGDSRILARQLSAGAVTTVHDFGAARIVRDVSWAGGRFAAIVDGLVQVYQDTGHPIQNDQAGRLFVVDGASGTEAELTLANTLFRHPTVAPDGASVVVEGYPLTITPIFNSAGGVIGYDTTIVAPSDIYRFTAP